MRRRVKGSPARSAERSRQVPRAGRKTPDRPRHARPSRACSSSATARPGGRDVFHRPAATGLVRRRESWRSCLPEDGKCRCDAHCRRRRGKSPCRAASAVRTYSPRTPINHALPRSGMFPQSFRRRCWRACDQSACATFCLLPGQTTAWRARAVAGARGDRWKTVRVRPSQNRRRRESPDRCAHRGVKNNGSLPQSAQNPSAAARYRPRGSSSRRAH